MNPAESAAENGSGETRAKPALGGLERLERTFAPLTKAPRIRRNLAFDTENWQHDGQRHKAGDFRLGVIYDGTTPTVYHDREQMAQAFYAREYEGAWFWAHNLAYDLQVLWGHEPPGHTCLINGNVYFTDIVTHRRVRYVMRKGKRTRVVSRRIIHFADTTRHYLGKLAKLGEYLGEPKLFDGLEDFDSLSDAQLEARCIQDTRIVWRFVTELQGTYNELGTSLNRTAGSSALECFRRGHMEREFVQLDEPDLVLLNQTYYGGRTEAFYRGNLADSTADEAPTWNLTDVVSMYPAVMRDAVMPIPSREHCWTTADPKRWHLDRPGGSRVTIKVPWMMYPPLPWRHPTSGKLLFPVGTLTGWWTHTEINYALSLGCELVAHHHCVWFDATCRPFQGFIDSLFQVRQRGGMYDLTAKLMMNSTYGKFGANNPPGKYMTYSEWMEYASDNREAGALVRAQAVSEYRDDKDRCIGIVIQKQGKEFPKHANQIWAAMITAGARIKLHGMLVKYEGLYCDTDSILTRHFVPESKELGDLSHKDTVIGGAILGPKCYQWIHPLALKSPTTMRIKGVPDRAGWYEDGEFAIECASVREHVLKGRRVAYLSPLKFVEGLRRETVPTLIPFAGPERPGGEPRRFIWGEPIAAKPNAWFPHTKCLKLDYDKREVLASGWTRPIQIGSGDSPSK